MKISATLLSTLFRASIDLGQVVLRANGADIPAATRDEMLKRCAAGDYVELELDVLAFEQQPGVSNRNFVRFRDGGVLAMARTGAGKPFLRDHDQYDSMARGGTIVASAAEKRADGDYAIRQTVKLTAPWAVDLALRGLLTSVSIGWNPTGPVLCTVCSANFYRCSHMPGQRYSAREDEGGGRTYVPDPAGALMCERLFTSAELVETSAVPVPAVPMAAIEAIRTALAGGLTPTDPDEHATAASSAAWHSFRASLAPDGDGLALQEPRMKNLQAFLAILGLASTGTEDDVLAGVKETVRQRDAAKSELAIAQKDLAIASKENEILSGEKKRTAEDKFVHEALATGRIMVGDEQQWRELHQLAPDRALALMAARPEGSVTPVGAKRQSANDPTPAPASLAGETRELHDALAKEGVDPGLTLELAGLFGAPDPVKNLGAVVKPQKKGA